ncbi:MAG: alpha/beta fold hydrolase [Bacteroidota bacterium]
MKRKRLLKNIFFRVFVPGFLLLNGVAFMHAWRFTHFPSSDTIRTARPEDLHIGQKIWILLTGISNPKSVNESPVLPVDTIWIDSRGEQMEAWWIHADSAHGIVLLFPGYAGRKSDLQAEAQAFHSLGYHCFMLDFPGQGGSSGHQTSVGFHESEDVRAAVSFVRDQHPDQELILFGFSMGAAAILKALHEAPLPVKAAIIGAPFGSLLTTVRNRFDLIGIPAFPCAELLVFWGGVQHSFWGFAHQPIQYASHIHTPILVMHGAKDERARLVQVEKIFDAIPGKKKLVIFDQLAHQSYYRAEPDKWLEAVKTFLDSR